MPMFKVEDGTNHQVHYEIIEGVVPETTLFIHGNLASNRWWYPTEQVLAKKNKNLKGNMILAEFRGCGKSLPPKTVDDVKMSVLANDFVQLVKSLNIGPVHLVGHSTGGTIAALMLCQAPTLFKKAIFLDPVGAKGVKFDEAMNGAFEAMKADKELTATVMASTIYQNDANSDFFRQVVVEDAYHAVKTVGAWVLKNFDGLDIQKQVAAIQNPVLVLHGEHDNLLSMQDSKDMAALMKNSRFEVVQGQGHCTNAENPAKFAEILSKFLYA